MSSINSIDNIKIKIPDDYVVDGIYIRVQSEYLIDNNGSSLMDGNSMRLMTTNNFDGIYFKIPDDN